MPEPQRRCDICYAPGPAWRYPCSNFSVPLLDSIGDWAICEQCHIWIEANEREKLRDVALFESTGDSFTTPKNQRIIVLGYMVQELHDQFFKHRLGPAQRIEEGKLCAS